MIKPKGYDEAETITGDFTPLPPGGYICRIINAEDAKSKSGREMLILNLDIVYGEYKDYFKRLYNSNPNNNNWPCVYRQMVDENGIGFFKGLIACIEKSNAGYTWNWDEKTLIGKLIGGLFGREEYLNPGKNEYRWATKIMYPKTVDDIKTNNFRIPQDKPAPNKTPNSNAGKSPAGAEPDYYEQPAPPVSAYDDLPF
jgi:hypothetical protein